MAKADAEIERLKALAQKLSVRSDEEASAPAAAAGSSSDGEENSEVESADEGSVRDGESGDDEDEGSGVDGGLAGRGASAKAADELAKGDPVLAGKLKKIDAVGKLQYRIAHGRDIDEAPSSDDDAGATRSLAQGGAKSLQLGQNHHTRLDRRLSQHKQTSTAKRAAKPASATPPTPPTPMSSHRVPAADDELTLGGPTVATPTLTRVGPHAALSGMAQRAASLALGGVCSLAGRSDDGSPESFVDVGGSEGSSRSLDRHDCLGRGFSIPIALAGGGTPAATPPAPGDDWATPCCSAGGSSTSAQSHLT